MALHAWILVAASTLGEAHFNDTQLAGLGAEGRAVVERMSGFILPLMHHLVQQRVQRLLPAMPPEMADADRDLADRRARPRRRRVVAEATLHPPRDASG